MMRAAAVRICFPSPSGFGGIGETEKVTGVAGDERDVFDMIRWVISRGMIPTGAIRLRPWTINDECAGSLLLRIRMCQKLGQGAKVCHPFAADSLTSSCNVHPKMLFISASCLLTRKDRSHAHSMLSPRWPWS